MANLYFRRLSDRAIVGTVNADNIHSSRQAERVMRGMLINMRDDLFVDDSELEPLYERERQEQHEANNAQRA